MVSSEQLDLYKYILHQRVARFGQDKNSVHLGYHKKCAYLTKWLTRQSTLKNTNEKVESSDCSVILTSDGDRTTSSRVAL